MLTIPLAPFLPSDMFFRAQRLQKDCWRATAVAAIVLSYRIFKAGTTNCMKPGSCSRFGTSTHQQSSHCMTHPDRHHPTFIVLLHSTTSLVKHGHMTFCFQEDHAVEVAARPAVGHPTKASADGASISYCSTAHMLIRSQSVVCA